MSEYDTRLDQFKGSLKTGTITEYKRDPTYNELVLGRMRCLDALADWDPLATLLKHHSPSAPSGWHFSFYAICLYLLLFACECECELILVPALIYCISGSCMHTEWKQKIARIGASCACALNRWDTFDEMVKQLPTDTYDGLFFNSLHQIHLGDYNRSQELIQQGRDILGYSFNFIFLPTFLSFPLDFLRSSIRKRFIIEDIGLT